MSLNADGGIDSEDLNARNYLEQIGNSMSEKLLANSDIINGVIISMKKSDVMCSESEDSDTSEFDKPDDLREFFNIHSGLVGSGHHMMPCCRSCGKEMDLVEGDTIYGEDWYHGNCWKKVQLQTITIPDS